MQTKLQNDLKVQTDKANAEAKKFTDLQTKSQNDLKIQTDKATEF